MKNLLLIFFAFSFLMYSCKKDDDLPDEENQEQNEEEQEEEEQVGTCNDTLLPLVFIHGFLASGDTYANQTMRFSSNNYCEDRMFAFDWNSLNQGGDNSADLDAFIDDVLQKTGSQQVNLAGHSAGGGVSYTYLSNPQRAAKVAYYVHIGSNPQSGPAGSNGEVPTLNIWSADDLIVQGGNISGAENAQLNGNDHYEIATSAATFNEMYRFFNNDIAPKTTDIESQSNIEISGKVLTLGENQPKAASIKIYALDPSDGSRVGSTADFTVNSGADGKWGPVSVSANQPYEFEVASSAPDERKVFYYREGFKRSNPMVYLRTLPPPSSFVSNLLGGIPEDDNQSALIVFASSQGVIESRDVLKIDGFEISTSDFADAGNNTIAFFLYDGNNNQQTDLSAQGLFANFPFLSGVDMYFQATTPEAIKCELNGRELFVRNKKSDSEGIVIAVFD